MTHSTNHIILQQNKGNHYCECCRLEMSRHYQLNKMHQDFKLHYLAGKQTVCIIPQPFIRVCLSITLHLEKCLPGLFIWANSASHLSLEVGFSKFGLGDCKWNATSCQNSHGEVGPMTPIPSWGNQYGGIHS